MLLNLYLLKSLYKEHLENGKGALIPMDSKFIKIFYFVELTITMTLLLCLLFSSSAYEKIRWVRLIPYAYLSFRLIFFMFINKRLCHIIWLIFNGKCCIIMVDK